MSRDPRTASPEHSIWLHLPEDTFRRHLVSLEERTNAVPIDPEVYDLKNWQLSFGTTSATLHILPIEIEQQFADDFARLVAVAEGAQSVAAVCIEEHQHPPTLTLQFAALDISFGGTVHTALHKISDTLTRVAKSKNAEMSSNITDDLFHQIIELHFLRLLGRLRSTKWEKPKYLSKSHKKPLWQDFANLSHRAGFLFTKREKALRVHVENAIASLAFIYEAFEVVSQDDELSSLLKLVDKSFEFCNMQEIKDLLSRLESSVGKVPTPQVGSAVKCLRQIQKIAGYRRMSLNLMNTARKYPELFQHGLKIEFLAPYKSVLTTIGYESWATSCHVHAEIQLASHYDLSSHTNTTTSFLRPRCIGISKWLCFLCYRFLQAHGCFFPSKTHGRLYDQWTIPDLAHFRPHIVEKYREVLNCIDEGIVRQIEEDPELYRIEPMTSLDCT